MDPIVLQDVVETFLTLFREMMTEIVTAVSTGNYQILQILTKTPDRMMASGAAIILTILLVKLF